MYHHSRKVDYIACSSGKYSHRELAVLLLCVVCTRAKEENAIVVYTSVLWVDTMYISMGGRPTGRGVGKRTPCCSRVW